MQTSLPSQKDEDAAAAVVVVGGVSALGIGGGAIVVGSDFVTAALSPMLEELKGRKRIACIISSPVPSPSIQPNDLPPSPPPPPLG